jgi:hypothetical protein
MYVLYECDGINVCNVYYIQNNKMSGIMPTNHLKKKTISCYSLVKHYRGEYRPEMEDRACIQGPVCESRNWGAYGNQPTISCYSLVKHYRGEYCT